MKIIDNFLSIYEKNLTEGILLDRIFPWYFNPSTVDKRDFTSIKINKHNLKIRDNNYFYHVFYQENKISSNYYEYIKNILDKSQIKFKNVVRIKANYLLKSDFKEDEMLPPHVDGYADNMYSFIYFVNDSDGDFRLFDNNLKVVKKIKPKKGQGVLFKSNMYHCGSCPVKNDYRLNINFVIEV